MPPACTRACLREYVAQLAGFEALYFGDAFHCPPSDLSRPAYVVFASQEAAKAAFKHMAGMHVPLKDTNNLGAVGLKEEDEAAGAGSFILLCSLWRTAQKPYVVNAAANRTDRVDKDFEACAALLAALGQHWVCASERADVQGIDVDLVAATQEAQAKNEWLTKRDMVDVLVYCLRRVYGYEYWKGQYLVEFGKCFHVRVEWRADV